MIREIVVLTGGESLSAYAGAGIAGPWGTTEGEAIATFRAQASDATPYKVEGERNGVLYLRAAYPRPQVFAVVGSDGKREVVWGIGPTEKAAREEAETSIAEAHPAPETRIEMITPEHADAVRAGDVSWPARA
jgi:hypothetical protein